jgi:hypothetical protein
MVPVVPGLGPRADPGGQLRRPLGPRPRWIPAHIRSPTTVGEERVRGVMRSASGLPAGADGSACSVEVQHSLSHERDEDDEMGGGLRPSHSSRGGVFRC